MCLKYAQFLEAHFCLIWKNPYFFIFSILRHMYEEAIFQKRKKSLENFFVQPPKCKICPKFHRFFSNTGSQSGRINIALKYKNVSRRMSTYLDSRILKIGPLVKKLPIMAHISKICPIFGGPFLPYMEKPLFFYFFYPQAYV